MKFNEEVNFVVVGERVDKFFFDGSREGHRDDYEEDDGGYE